jgi:uncharacterized protein YciI
MAKHVVLLRDKNKGTLTKELLLRHIGHLRSLKAEGRLHLCGPFKDDSGGFILIEAGSEKEAIDLASRDPFIREGYYRSLEVHELMESGEHNNWLMDDDQTKGNLKD